MRINYCKYKKIQSFNCIHIDSINLLSELGIPLFKILSSDLTNVLYLRHIKIEKTNYFIIWNVNTRRGRKCIKCIT